MFVQIILDAYLVDYLGTRFGKLQVKLALARILTTYTLTLDAKTGKHLEMETKTQHIALQHKNRIWVHFQRL